MNKKSQTNELGIGTTPDYGRNMNLFAQMDIIFVEVKDRSRQSPTTNEPALVKHKEHEDRTTTEQLLVTLCEAQESLIEEQEEKIHDLEIQLQDYEQEIYEKDQIIQGGALP